MFYVLTNETSDRLPTSGDFSCYWYVDCLVVYCKDRLLLFLSFLVSSGWYVIRNNLIT